MQALPSSVADALTGTSRVIVVVAGIALALTIPPLRELFRNDAYRDMSWALLSAFLLIPLQTVIPEELLFRGIITGALLRRRSVRVTIGVQRVKTAGLLPCLALHWATKAAGAVAAAFAWQLS